jgi:outer membrane protein OmpA-like peptidoglycan-associated protein
MNTPRTLLMTLTAAAACLAMAACTTTPPNNATLDEAHSDFRSAQANPQAVQLAAIELKQAEDALKLADDAWSRRDSDSDVEHLAYLAKQRVAIAQAVTVQKSSEQSVENADAARGKVQLAARTREVSAAEQNAEASQQQANRAEARSSDLEAQLRALNAKQTDRGVVITIGDVLFDTGKSDLRSGGTQSVQKLADFLKQYPLRTALIEGYTDSVGGDMLNDQLSERRAESVRSALMRAGISGDRLAAKGYGEEYPAAGNNSSSGRQLNRRVEVILSDDNGKVMPR